MIKHHHGPGFPLARRHGTVSQRINGIPQIRDYVQVAGYGMIMDRFVAAV